jgi:hypothetical protein
MAPSWGVRSMRQPSRWPPAIGALAVMAIVFSIVYGTVHSARQNDKLIGQNAALIDYIEDDQKADDAEDRKEAEARRKILAGVDALLDWVTGRGISVPDYILQRVSSDDSDDDGDDDGDDGEDTDGSGKQSPPKSGSTATTPRKPEPQRTGRPARPDRGSDRSDDQGRRGSGEADRSDAEPDKPEKREPERRGKP